MSIWHLEINKIRSGHNRHIVSGLKTYGKSDLQFGRCVPNWSVSFFCMCVSPKVYDEHLQLSFELCCHGRIARKFPVCLFSSWALNRVQVHTFISIAGHAGICWIDSMVLLGNYPIFRVIQWPLWIFFKPANVIYVISKILDIALHWHCVPEWVKSQNKIST